jgi:very-short-patch-repair endonuclease
MIEKKIINNIEYYSANYIYKEWANGKYCKKQKSQFFTNQSTKSLIYKLNNEVINPCYITGRGSGELSGTWIIKELIPYYFNWLNKLPAPSYTRTEMQFCNIIEESFKGILKFEKQKPLDYYIIDMYCEELNLCIEYDEKYHKYTKEYDKKREDYIKLNYGYEIIRHLENDNIGIIINKIYKMYENKSNND